ncbi:uracil-DNA glycosylase [Halocynthiibacter namhaensis]|uniref:uracil-DNA glycosylase n=1 Tax=Halocynthiibacter namhaensis TaxID=1290553 RepID=UPI00057909E0|nr:uracil-DNA glycosylase [Halocynthiibacter namhaensis]
MKLESMDHWQLRAALEWQVELGADETLLDAPVNRYEMPAKPAAAVKSKKVAEPAAIVEVIGPDPAAEAKAAANQAQDLAGLERALAMYEHCELKRGARNLVFGDGNPNARVMVIGEAPDRDEDRQGKPFVGAVGQLLDNMLAAIDMARDATDTQQAVYVTNVLPWRPPQSHVPQASEIAMMRPFVQRHIELVQPDIIIAMGNVACDALLGKRGITRMRGTWGDAFSTPVMPMLHPSDLLRRPEGKRDAWNDLLNIQEKLNELK